jgi:hypothetical protein
MMSMYRNALCMAVLSATAVGGGCMTGDADDEETAAAELELGGADRAAPSDPQAPADLLVAPPAPDGAASKLAGGDKGEVSILAATPTISPGTAFEDVAPGQIYTCALGTLCTGVWNPNLNKWRVFKLVTCTTYAVFNWNGSGFYWDNQTGNPATMVFGQNGAQLNPPGSIFPGGGQLGIDWNPVFSIRNC